MTRDSSVSRVNLHERARDGKWAVCHAAVMVAQLLREKSLQSVRQRAPTQEPVREKSNESDNETVKKRRVLPVTTTVTMVKKQQMRRRVVVTLYE